MLLEELIKGQQEPPVPGVRGCVARSREIDWRLVRVCDITEDSRTVMPGSLFVARRGEKADGRQFAAAAARAGASAILCERASELTLPEGHECDRVVVIECEDVAGASAAIAERFYASASRRLRVAGVTGTNGKTTTTWLAWRLLNQAGVRCGLIGTVVIDDGVEVASAEMTTPPATEVSRLLARMLESGCRACVMEVSSHSLDQRRVAGLRFDCAAFTNLTRDHLDYHGTMENYAAAKARLFEMLDERALAVVNTDGAWAQRMVERCRASVVACGAERPAACRVVRGETDRRGMRLEMSGPWGALDVRVPLVGAFNAMNVLQAVVIAHRFGLDLEQLARGCATLDAPPGRLERVATLDHEPQVIVDYAHTDDGLANALSTVRELVEPGGRLIVVFGCGGDRDRGKRPKMGEVAATQADVVVVTSDNPRSERPGAIIDEILGGIDGSQRSRVTVQADRARAIDWAIEHAGANDLVLIAGKGHETEQISSDGKGGLIREHFDDREQALIALRRLRGENSAVVTPPRKPGRRSGRGAGLG